MLVNLAHSCAPDETHNVSGRILLVMKKHFSHLIKTPNIIYYSSEHTFPYSCCFPKNINYSGFVFTPHELDAWSLSLASNAKQDRTNQSSKWWGRNPLKVATSETAGILASPWLSFSLKSRHSTRRHPVIFSLSCRLNRPPGNTHLPVYKPLGPLTGFLLTAWRTLQRWLIFQGIFP